MTKLQQLPVHALAATGPKPELVLRDTVSNHIEMTKNVESRG